MGPSRRIVLFSLALAAILAGCGGSKKPQPGPDSPVISNLIVGPSCEWVQFDYVDPNGDVRGGHVCDIVGCLDVPEDVTVTGTTTGRITAYRQNYPGNSCRPHIYLYDAAGNVSNTLETEPL